MAVGGMRQHRHLFILTVFLPKVIFNGIKGYWSEIMLLHTAIEIAPVFFSIVKFD
jgi:hypothetical protein